MFIDLHTPPPDPRRADPPPPSADDVRGVLGGVIDPELHAIIVDLGMVDDVRVADDGPSR